MVLAVVIVRFAPELGRVLLFFLVLVLLPLLLLLGGGLAGADHLKARPAVRVRGARDGALTDALAPVPVARVVVRTRDTQRRYDAQPPEHGPRYAPAPVFHCIAWNNRHSVSSSENVR
jgi:hypothetical protein